ncbi:hypothetical protein SBOR_8414 [Sclerotinia borealis F-4128]|uniref:DUF7492 domain-containing protein n=1 Tax=Sclerotinia borealis (strain F-4128) TaxID=1432307 RepID=W9C343_SCLBF|nr:hypothetical protein SBOR_8414 [Sclerotinia borealis F-4128]
MKFTASISIAALALLIQTTTAHTWADELRVIARNGTFTSTGYPRGFVPRTDKGNPDDNLYELQNIIPNDAPICGPKQLKGAAVNPLFPTLSAAPGDFVAIRYQENGHVTEPTQSAKDGLGKGFGSGLVYVYGTADSKATDMYNSIHKVWNKDGTGGDKRGKLLAVQYFDDMECFLAGNTNGDLFVDPPTNKTTLAMARQAAYYHETDGLMGVNLWCQTDFQIPAEAQANKDYSIYWVWDWPTMDQTTGKQTLNQSYTACADIAIAGSVNTEPIAYVAPQDLNNAAQWSQMVNPFVVDPTAAQKPWSLRVTTELFATPTPNGIAASTGIGASSPVGTTAHVQPTTASSSITQQTSITQQSPSTTQQAATTTYPATQQGFTTVTVYVTLTSGVAEPTSVATAAQAGVGAPSGVASASGSKISVEPFMKRSIQIRGRNVD